MRPGAGRACRLDRVLFRGRFRPRTASLLLPGPRGPEPARARARAQLGQRGTRPPSARRRCLYSQVLASLREVPEARGPHALEGAVTARFPGCATVYSRERFGVRWGVWGPSKHTGDRDQLSTRGRQRDAARRSTLDAWAGRGRGLEGRSALTRIRIVSHPHRAGPPCSTCSFNSRFAQRKRVT